MGTLVLDATGHVVIGTELSECRQSKARSKTRNQLLRRMRLVQRDLATDIELDYRRDLTVAQAEVVVVATAAWAVPLVVLYGLGYLIARRRRIAAETDKEPAKPADSDARYRPGFDAESVTRHR